MTTATRPPQLAVLPDPSGLLAEIIRSPAEDTVRLAYADWLDENPSPPVRCPYCNGAAVRYGLVDILSADRFVLPDAFGPEGEPMRRKVCRECKGAGEVRDDTNALRAEYIRRWVRAEHVRHFVTRPDEHEEIVANAMRINDLYPLIFNRYGFRSGVAEAGMDRGFIASISTTWDWWAEHGDTLRAREWVPRVKLSEAPDLQVQRLELDRTQVWLDGTNATVVYTNPQWRERSNDTIRLELLADRYPGTEFTWDAPEPADE